MAQEKFVLSIKKTGTRIAFTFAFLLFMCCVSAQDSACVGYANIGQKKVVGISIGGSPGTPRYVSLLQYTPKTYNPADFVTLYPVLIFFPGYGTASALPPFGIDPCRLIYDQPTSLPGKIAENKFRDSVFSDGKWYHYIVLSFQYNTYNYPSDFPSASSVDSVIDYVLANYRADPARVYLTGMSSGANIVVEYGGNSVARAQRVAAISVSSTCSQVGVFPNSTSAGANIASGRLATRFISCTSDGTCPHTSTQNWVTNINANSPNPPAELITLNGSAGALACEGFTHNSWNKLYDSSFRSAGMNLFEWNIQFSRNATVPVLLEGYTVRLINGKVVFTWSTSKEINASSFGIEKAGVNQQFSEIGSIKSAGNSTIKNQYNFIDEKPFTGINYYRLVQKDADNNKHYFETRKIINVAKGKISVIVFPNPVSDEVTLFFSTKNVQRVTYSLINVNGKVVKTKAGIYSEGSTGITINTSNLPKGVYFLRTVGEDFIDIQKLLKQ